MNIKTALLNVMTNSFSLGLAITSSYCHWKLGAISSTFAVLMLLLASSNAFHLFRAWRKLTTYYQSEGFYD